MVDVDFGVDFPDTELRVERSASGADYEVRDRNGTTLLQVRHERPGEGYVFEDSHGKPVFTVTGDSARDGTGDYALVEETTEETVVSLTESSSMVHENWTVEVLDGGAKTVHVGGVKLPGALSWLIDSGGKFTVADSDGNVLGSVSKSSGENSVATIEIGEENDGQRSSVVAGALAIAVLGTD